MKKTKGKQKAVPLPPLETRVAVPMRPSRLAKIATVVVPLLILVFVGYWAYRIGYEQGAIDEIEKVIAWNQSK